MRCLSISYMVIAAAALALRELTCPFIGRLTIKSQLSATSHPIPSPSEPITSASAPVKSVVQRPF